MAKVKKVDAIFAVSLALTAIVSISAVQAERAEPDLTEPKETVCQTTTETTTEETTEPKQEPFEAVLPATDVTEQTETEQPVILYDVPLDEELQLHIIETAKAHGIDPAIIFAMAYRESTYNPDAIGDGGNSLGLMQVQEMWHEERMERLNCPNLLDPFQNVTVAVDYLAEMLGWYGGDIAKALTAYNRGSYEGTVTGYATAVLEIAEELEVIG